MPKKRDQHRKRRTRCCLGSQLGPPHNSEPRRSEIQTEKARKRRAVDDTGSNQSKQIRSGKSRWDTSMQRGDETKA
ncbi:hypothetical protein EUGRSUZ_D01167 [Eucalyptus grandis]|uniref:Uncharacterized protein n=2 Tax=Eucalyptus grandis TaxID=71139 RepID=A0ACC3L5G5_EUCGR|nr:hypothetical protein EUGRSUZ_D01167 [Eucalyptus grandis]